MGGFLSHQEVFQSGDALDASCGPVRGNIYEPKPGKKIHGYLGIPYAKPPIRFTKPQPAERWTQPLDCYKYGPRCPQDMTFPGLKPLAPGDEFSCLTLNVFTPAWKSDEFPNGRPVMVFIHGGGYEVGCSSDYCDKSFAGSIPIKDVVLVSINYRLGAFGFLVVDNLLGNYGLWDQTLALHWIQDHIRSFGGDPRNVTIFGESAGAASCDLLNLSPHSRDLFHRSISMSGTADCEFAVRPIKYQKSVCEDVARFKGYQGSDFLDWYRTTEDLKWSILPKPDFKPEMKGMLTFSPVIDGDFFPKPIDELRKEAGPRQVLLGTCEFEGLLFGSMNGLEGEQSLNLTIRARIKKSDYGTEVDRLREKVKNFYKDGKDLTKQCILLIGDDFDSGVIETVRKLDGTGSTVYFYDFTHFEPNTFGMLNGLLTFQGATHATDLRYVTGEGTYSKFEPTEKDLQMHEMMTTWFTNFAKYGSPGENWPKYDSSRPLEYFRIGFPSEIRDNYQENRYEKLWKEVRSYNLCLNETHRGIKSSI